MNSKKRCLKFKVSLLFNSKLRWLIILYYICQSQTTPWLVTNLPPTSHFMWLVLTGHFTSKWPVMTIHIGGCGCRKCQVCQKSCFHPSICPKTKYLSQSWSIVLPSSVKNIKICFCCCGISNLVVAINCYKRTNTALKITSVTYLDLNVFGCSPGIHGIYLRS